MLNLVQVSSVLLLAGSAAASFTRNVNYFSPSLHHPSLGVSVGKVAKRTAPAAPCDPAKLNFTHGVASGDPYDHSVILWTRVAPTSDNNKSNATVSGTVDIYSHETESYIKNSDAPVCVDWKIGTSAHFEKGTVVNHGTAYTTSDIDYTVKVCSKPSA